MRCTVVCAPHGDNRIIETRLRWAGRVAERKAYRILVGKTEGMRPLKMSKLEDNIKRGLKGTEWERLDLIDLAQERGR